MLQLTAAVHVLVRNVENQDTQQRSANPRLPATRVANSVTWLLSADKPAKESLEKEKRTAKAARRAKSKARPSKKARAKQERAVDRKRDHFASVASGEATLQQNAKQLS